MTDYALPFSELSAADLPRAGGKGANLGELVRAGLPVPPGFCVSTAAFVRFLHDDEQVAALLAELEQIPAADLEGARRMGLGLRTRLGELPIPVDVAASVRRAWTELGADDHYAVRSSATAEDLPEASFAGQQDTFLNVQGEAELMARLRDCWASLFTDRAIVYRTEHGIPHQETSLSVVIQKMVPAEVSGVLFTADPLSGHRRRMSIDAAEGLGDDLVSGRVVPESWLLDRQDGSVVHSREVRGLLAEPARTELLRLGEAAEAHFGQPQDIEWCLVDGRIELVQSRPITTLYPLPDDVSGDHAHLWFCFNHFQVMTDAMSRVGQSVWKLLLPLGRRAREVRHSPWAQSAGDRLYLDFGPLLRFAPTRKLLQKLIPRVDERAAAAMEVVMARPGFMRGERVPLGMLVRVLPRIWKAALWTLLFRRPEGSFEAIEAQLEEFVERRAGRIRATPPGAAQIEVAREEIAGMLPELFVLPPAILTSLVAAALVGRLVRGAGTADIAALSRGLDGNVTVEMDQQLGDLADVVRQQPAVAAALQAGVRDRATLEALPGGDLLHEQLDRFLARWGARGIAEIDLGRPRWRDAPASLLGMLAGNLGREPGAHREHHAELRRSRLEAGEKIEAMAGRGLLGWPRRRFVSRLIRLHWNMAPLREHPKFALVRVLQVVRDAVLEAGSELTSRGLLPSPEAAIDFELGELAALLRGDPDAAPDPAALAAERQSRRRRNQQMGPPRVLTDHGEAPRVELDAGDAPDGALRGTPVSAGVVEGLARVIHDPAGQTLQPGEILVAPHTDPGWTPLFLNAAGLVMEVGGLVTHGSVVAREYGIPAVVCVPDACKTISTGQRLRVDGDRGWVEILGDPTGPPIDTDQKLSSTPH